MAASVAVTALLLAAGASPAASAASDSAGVDTTQGIPSHTIVPVGLRRESGPRPGARGRAAPTPGLQAYALALHGNVRDGLVDYDRLASTRAYLDFYLKELASVDSTKLGARARSDRMAFWINAYNPLVLDLILRNLHGPDGKGPRLESVRDNLLTFIALDLPRQDALALRKTRVRIDFLPYDWSLNDASARR